MAVLGDVSDVKFGATQVTSVYLGTQLVWSTPPAHGRMAPASGTAADGGVSTEFLTLPSHQLDIK